MDAQGSESALLFLRGGSPPSRRYEEWEQSHALSDHQAPVRSQSALERQAIISAFSRTWVTRRAELRAEGKASFHLRIRQSKIRMRHLGHKWYKEQLCVCPPHRIAVAPQRHSTGAGRSALDLGSPFVHVLELPAPTSLKWSSKWSVSTAQGRAPLQGRLVSQPAPCSPPFLLGSAPPHTPLPDYLLFSSQDQGPPSLL